MKPEPRPKGRSGPLGASGALRFCPRGPPSPGGLLVGHEAAEELVERVVLVEPRHALLLAIAAAAGVDVDHRRAVLLDQVGEVGERLRGCAVRPCSASAPGPGRAGPGRPGRRASRSAARKEDCSRFICSDPHAPVIDRDDAACHLLRRGEWHFAQHRDQAVSRRAARRTSWCHPRENISPTLRGEVLLSTNTDMLATPSVSTIWATGSRRAGQRALAAPRSSGTPAGASATAQPVSTLAASSRGWPSVNPLLAARLEDRLQVRAAPPGSRP